MSNDLKDSNKPKLNTMYLTIPQMGEGLRMVRIAKLYKEPGDSIKEDEIIYSIETEKSLVEIESPYNGFLAKWLVKEEDMLEVGANIAIVEIL